MKKLTINGNYFIITDTETGSTLQHPKEMIRAEDYGTIIHFYFTQYATQILEYEFDILVDENEQSFSSISVLFDWLNKNTGSIAKNGAIDVFIQDSTAPLIIVKFSKLITETTTTSLLVKEDRIINVADATSFDVGQLLTIYNKTSNRVFFATILNVNILAITLDSPLDFEYPSGSPVSIGDTNMNVDGSVTPQIFGVRNPTGEDVPLAFDVTRIMFKCLTATTVDLSKFGDIVNGLLKGIVLRRVDGTYRNIFNVKTNAELKNITYDFDVQTVSGNQQDGFTSRLTFAGQNKMGAVVRIGENEDLQLIVQDNLEALSNFIMIAEGSEVTF